MWPFGEVRPIQSTSCRSVRKCVPNSWLLMLQIPESSGLSERIFRLTCELRPAIDLIHLEKTVPVVSSCSNSSNVFARSLRTRISWVGSTSHFTSRGINSAAFS